MKCILKMYDGVKYYDDTCCVKNILLENVAKWKVKHICSDIAVELFGESDEFDEYLHVYFKNGKIKIYNNSEVDLFKY